MSLEGTRRRMARGSEPRPLELMQIRDRYCCSDEEGSLMTSPDADASAVTVPELTLPFPARVHPAVEAIDEGTVGWLLDFGLIRGAEQERYVRAIGLGRWFPHLLPSGDEDRALLASQLTAWYTLLDDQVAEKHGNRLADLAMVMGQLVHCEDTGRLPQASSSDDVLQRALRDLSLRLREVAVPEQLLRLQWHAVQYYLGITTEAAYAAQGVMPEVSDYVRIRRLTTCMPPFFVMSEIVQGFSTPLDLVLQPRVQELTTLAVDLTAIANDIIGFPRDVERGDPWTYARVLAHHHACDLQAAVTLMTEQWKEKTQRFVHLADQLRGADSAGTARYVTALQELVAGHLEWSQHSPRYKISEHFQFGH